MPTEETIKPMTNNAMYLLVDAAQYPGIWRILQYRFRRLQWLSLFEDTSDIEAVSAGPVLIQVSANQTKTLAWFLEHTQDIHGLSWMLSSLSLIALRGHLQSLMQVESADGSECSMRFFDTRILPVWYDVLSYEQKLHAYGPVVMWSFVNREGMECTIKGKEQGIAPLPKTLRLSPSQEQALLDAALPDVIVQRLTRAGNADLAAMPQYQRHDFIADQVDKARTHYQIHSLPDLLLFCKLALSIGENFDQLQSVAQVLQNFAHAKGEGELESLGMIQTRDSAAGHNVPISLLVAKVESASGSESNQRG